MADAVEISWVIHFIRLVIHLHWWFLPWILNLQAVEQHSKDSNFTSKNKEKVGILLFDGKKLNFYNLYFEKRKHNSSWSFWQTRRGWNSSFGERTDPLFRKTKSKYALFNGLILSVLLIYIKFVQLKCYIVTHVCKSIFGFWLRITPFTSKYKANGDCDQSMRSDVRVWLLILYSL